MRWSAVPVPCFDDYPQCDTRSSGTFVFYNKISGHINIPRYACQTVLGIKESVYMALPRVLCY